MKTMREDVVEMNYHVSIKEIPERYVASVRKVIPSYNCEGDLWTMLMQEIHIKILVWPIRVIVSLSSMIKNTKK